LKPSPGTKEPERSSAQPRVIGTLGGLSIVVGSMLGIGIFLSPSQVATHVPCTWGYLVVWVISGLIAFSGAVAYAELGTRFPSAGGDYVFLKEAFGPSVGFASGWLLFIGVFAGSVATMAVPIGHYQVPALLAPWIEVDPDASLFSVSGLGVTWLNLTLSRAVGVVLIVVLTLLNVIGTRLSTGVQFALTALPVLLLALGSAYIFLLVEPTHAALSRQVEEPVVGFGRAILAVYFAFAGWNSIAYVGGEMASPGKTIPRSLLGGTVVITALYLLMAGAFLYVLGIDGLSSACEAGTATVRVLAGEGGAVWVTALIALALIGSVNATILAGGRVGWAMARSGALRRSLGTLHGRYQTPSKTLLLQGAVAILFVLTGSFQLLLELAGVAMMLMSTLTMVALFVIRRRDGTAAPYRATLYPWLPGFFLLISTAVIGAQLYRAAAGTDRMSFASFYPLIGLAVFVAMLVGHSLWGRKER